jgi:hypothetical protein
VKQPDSEKSELARRLRALREAMKQESLDAYIVRGTDRFLNE